MYVFIKKKNKAFSPIMPYSYLFTFLGKWEILFWEVPTWSFPSIFQQLKLH